MFNRDKRNAKATDRAAEWLLDGETIDAQATVPGVGDVFVTSRGLRVHHRKPGGLRQFTPWGRVTQVDLLDGVTKRQILVQITDRVEKLPVAWREAPMIYKAIQSHLV